MENVKKLTVAAFHSLAATGHISADERVELIGGMMIEMPPIGRLRSDTIERLSAVVRSVLGAGVVVATGRPLHATSEIRPVRACTSSPAHQHHESPKTPARNLLPQESAIAHAHGGRHERLPLERSHWLSG